MDTLTSLHAPIRSSFIVHEKISDAQGAFFEVPAKHKGQKLILFGRIKSEQCLMKVQKIMLSFHNSLITGYEYDLPPAYTQNYGMLHRWYCSEEPWKRRSSCRSEESIQHYAGTITKDEPNQVFPGWASDKFLGFVLTSKGIHLDPEKIRAI